MKLYHLSKNPNLTELTPKVPETAVPMYEDCTQTRVCFAKSISGCLSALQDIEREYYVYIPTSENIEYYKPTVDEVRDASINGEVWSKEKVQVKCIGKIKSKYNNEKNREYVIIKSNGKKEIVKRYYYKWKWKQKF